jgi:hypothetical protein
MVGVKWHCQGLQETCTGLRMSNTLKNSLTSSSLGTSFMLGLIHTPKNRHVPQELCRLYQELFRFAIMPRMQTAAF